MRHSRTDFPQRPGGGGAKGREKNKPRSQYSITGINSPPARVCPSPPPLSAENDILSTCFFFPPSPSFPPCPLPPPHPLPWPRGGGDCGALDAKPIRSWWWLKRGGSRGRVLGEWGARFQRWAPPPLCLAFSSGASPGAFFFPGVWPVLPFFSFF